ncbi:TIGR03752 family integrating conjugative element protein [Pseudomonas gingeri]|uniref:TIGR03752 family integrating conjugative element protein n=1 Tax=Pseudomonas gingeri TaxID=117681 RepID=UPI0015A3FDA3|nr:TIGR03752 family integrating conjugative element protein [Pseudomonas gingeri]NWA02326.1 TIGR03752 family integrating conjugative element protein [Pseudomonas gingeri]NWA12501.1 TIGR03752 family integrating conjugative element protein [Pseudomonas gingeri]NWA57093.1 TIGR03752 family integrating conjugative element protein [Pseudomonas gingeri]NWA93436.1 TIGR03752 family integrating conjugative element protein [Pseudomonas gingeri]NWB02908.1 TIGR03752 family integrating conjugative element p
MRSSGMLKWLVLPLVLLVLFGVIRACSSKDTSGANTEHGGHRLTAEEMKQLGIDGDTPHDTVATLVAQTKAMREELKALLSENQDQQQENIRLRRRDSEIDQRIQQVLGVELEKAQHKAPTGLSALETQSLLDDLQQKLSVQFSASRGADLPIGLGLEPGDEGQFSASNDDLVWTEPQDATSVDARGKPLPAGSGKPALGLSFPTAFSDEAGQRKLEADAGGGNVKAPADKASARPVYTLPENSTLTGSVAMTALIGRVPVDGVVNDPYPFKVLIGPDNLTANGIDLPDVAGAVLSGTAAGDWTLSCVRGHIVSLTFVFNDGRIRTLPAPKKLTSRQGGNQTAGTPTGKIQGGIGWLSDPYGVPCIAGERRSNAQQYLGSKSLVTAAGAGLAALLEANKADASTVITPGGAAVGAGPSALNSILSGGVKDIGDWVNKLYGQAFAAVYVQPGAQVAVHLDRQLEIDYEPLGRQVRHIAGGTHASTLD